MAYADYRLCDVCGGKAFYDSHLNYGDADVASYRVAGKPQYENPELNEKYGVTLDRVGDWAVICHECAETHECKIIPRQPKGNDVSDS